MKRTAALLGLATIGLVACGATKVPTTSKSLGAQAQMVGKAVLAPVAAPRPVVSFTPIVVPDNHVVIFIGSVSGIYLDGATNVPVNTAVKAHFTRAQDPAAIRMRLSPMPRWGLSCSWSNGNLDLTCSSNVMMLAYSTTYTASVYNINAPTVDLYTATFKTTYPVMAP